MIMANEIPRTVGVSHRPSPPLKRFRFVFQMEYASTFGGPFVCLASDKLQAWKILERSLPGAAVYVKNVYTLN